MTHDRAGTANGEVLHGRTLPDERLDSKCSICVQYYDLTCECAATVLHVETHPGTSRWCSTRCTRGSSPQRQGFWTRPSTGCRPAAPECSECRTLSLCPKSSPACQREDSRIRTGNAARSRVNGLWLWFCGVAHPHPWRCGHTTHPWMALLAAMSSAVHPGSNHEADGPGTRGLSRASHAACRRLSSRGTGGARLAGARVGAHTASRDQRTD